jgi:hypothetical protein
VSEETEKELTQEDKMRMAQEARENRNNERLALMDKIADGAEDRRADTGEIQIEEPLQEEVPEVAEPQAGDERVVDGVTHYLTIVNGHEKWLTLKQLRETAGKVEAADDYLRQAKEAVINSTRAAPSKKDESADLEEDEVRKLLSATALGDEEAISRLAKAITARPSQQDVLRALDQRMSFRTELASLEEKSRDLLDDEYMGRLFKQRLNELKQEAPSTPLADAYSSIDKELRTAFPSFKAQSQSKLDRKRTLSQVPQAAARRAVQTEDEGEEDPSSVIEEMAKARGLKAHLHRRQ